MSFRFKPLVLTAFAMLCTAAPAFSQAFMQGVVKGADGKVIDGAVIAFDRLDIKFHVEAKTDKKGHYITNMAPQAYAITVTVDGVVRDKVNRFDVAGGNNPPLDFNLSAAPTAAGGAAPAAAPDKAGKGVSKEEADKAAKEKEAQLTKRKELNDSFAAGKTALENKQWDVAIASLSKAAELDGTQVAVWAALADAYLGSAKATRGDDATPLFAKTFATFDKLIELKPDDAGSYNNYALALAAAKRIDDAKVKIAKAVELDPPNAGKYHYNLGALLMNSNQTDGAVEEFKKSIDADPNYAEAYYYYGSTLVGKATLDQKTGAMVAPPGTVEALQKYVSLKPDGPNASSAKDLIAALGATVTTNYKDPSAPAPKATKKGK